MRHSLHTLTELMKGHHEKLSNTRCRLLEMKLVPGYDSYANCCQEVKKYIELFKTMHTNSIEALKSCSSDLKVLLLVQNKYTK